ncbi:Ig-like domain-containing protein, partial [Acinetobacter gerneri]
GLSGTSEANALITLDLGHGNTLTTTANSQGKWSFVPNPITDGETATLTATDAAGNIGPSMTTDKADTVAPLAPSVEQNNAFGLSGSSEANALITLDLGHGNTLTTTANSQGKWSFVPNPIADGETGKLTATDTAGNVGPSITTEKADTVAPLAPSVEQNNAANLSGTSEANALITLDLGNGNTLTTTANSQGKWLFAPNPIADGETATLTATDAAGNIGPSITTDKADTIAPLAPSVEQNNAANLSGSSEANALITLDLGNGNTLTTTANSQGKWSFTPNPITDGETGKLTATDAAGNVGSSITTDKADTVAPLAPSVELNNASELSGSSEANAVITLDLGNGTTLTTTANSQGKWSFAPNPIADGETATLTATDAAGNVGAETTTDKADTVAPFAPSVEQNNAASLSGTSEANAVITLDLGNGHTLTTTANSQGKWSFTPNPIADGETGKLTATDAAGNVGAETTTDKADTIAPLAPSVDQNNASGLSGTSEANAVITLDLGNGHTLTTTANSQGKWSFVPNPIADGETGKLTATDTAGNVGPSITTEKADTVAPLAPSVEQNNAASLSGTSEANALITLDLGHGNTLTTTANSQGKWSFVPNPIADGETGKLTATDTAGNVGPSITTDQADTVAPLAPSVELNNAASLSGTSEANALITLDLGNGTTLTTTANSQGTWSFAPNPIADGETGKLTATDAAGNVGAETTTEKADTVAPLAPSVEQNNAANLSGTSEANAVITLDLGNGHTLTTTANSQGKWSFVPNPIADGETATLTATDVAGNVGAETTTDKTDTVAPLAPSVGLNNASGLSGTSEANSLITLDLGNGHTLTTTANSQGKWSFVPNPIADGETATLTATDTAGNIGPSITTDKADTIAPLAPSVEQNNASELSGSSEANAVITLDLGNGTTLTTTANSQGKWSFVPNPITDGETATLTATDAAGNVGAETTTDKADTVAPLAPSVDLNNAAGLVGTSEANAVITLDLGHSNTLTTTANSQGKWVFAPNPIADGETGTLTATDAAGNIGPSMTTDKADTVAPLAPSVELNNASELSGSSEANAVITLDLGNGHTLTTTADSQGKWVFAPNPIADGETGTLTATDAAGNIGPSMTTDKADTVAPLAPSVEQNNAASLSGTSEANALITLDLGHGHTLTTIANSQGKWSFAPNPIADGETGKLTATDIAGNVGPSITTEKADTVAPLAPSVELNNASGLSGSSEANAVIMLDLGNGNTLTTTADSQGKWSFAPNPIADGETGKLTATDAAGNVGASITTDKADTIAPLAPSVEQNNASGLSGGSEANAVITLDLGDGHTLTTTANSQGKWSFAPNPIADGETGKLTATDAAGNVGPEITTDKADTVAPLAPSVDQNNAAGLVGTSEANAVITLDLGNGNTLTTTANSQGKWSFAPNPIADGETAMLTATDAAGNVGAETTTEKADTVPPLAPSVEQNNAPGLSGASEANALITLDLGDGNTLTTTADENGLWSFKPNPLADGTSGAVTAMDAAGNESSVKLTGVADTVAPTAPIIKNNSIAELAGRAEPDSVVTVKDIHGNTVTTITDSTGKWSVTMPGLSEGDMLSVTATDVAGNVSEPTLVNVVTVSEVYATIDSYTDNVGAFVGDFLSGTSTDDTSPVLNGTLSALLENGQVLRIYAGTTLMGTATIDGKNWSCALSNLADATYTFTAVIETDTGISGTPSDPFTLIVDTVSPTTTTIIAFHDDVGAVQGDFTGTGTVTDDRQIQLSGKLSDTLFVDEKVLIYNGTTLLGFAKVSGTEWTFDVTDLLKNGVNYTFTAVVADTTGNTASKASVNFTVALNVGIQGQTTADTTPLLTGTINFDMLTATEHLNVIVNGVTYSSLTGAVVLDLANHKWYVQIPDANILTAKTYTVTAQVVKTDDGSVVSSLANAPLIIQSTADVAPTTSSWATTANPGSSTNNTISYALNTDGLWTIVANHQVYNSTSISNYTHYATLTTSHGTTVSVAGLDFNRSGLLSIASTDTSYSNSTQSFYTNTGSGYALSQLNMGTTIYYGGVVVYDKTGDGYLDLVYGDGGNDSVTFIANTNGVLGLDGANGHAGMPDYDTGRELSGVDINNDGAVDIVQHAEHAGAYGLTVIKNNGTSLSVGQSIANVFENYNANSTSSASLTWADFNGDGYMDLYLSTGYNNTVGGIYYNNAGKLSSTISTVGSTASAGYLSVALDWNHDGMMDLVKFTTYGTAQTATLFTNLNSGTNWNTGLLRSGLVNVTGIAALDYDWDGAVDLMVSQANGSIALIHNEQAIAKGTAMHLRIVDSEGINVYYGNTVQLYDSKGRLVASQIINPQSGIGSNDASAIVNFYGLDPNETYSATIVKMNKGVSNNVTWTGLVAGDGTESYALTAVAATGIHSGTLTGTGYNDTFIADTGTYVYNGSGGWSKVSGFGVWSATGGIDIVDYRNSTSGITIDLSKTGYQITGYNFAKFINIEGIAGTSNNDVFTNNGVDNYFEGRGGNDIFNLINHGGHDTLIYKLINAADATGGNGVDTVNGFFVGTFETAPDADRIDIQGLLNGYTASGTDGYSAKYINGVATINAGDNIASYLNVYFDGTNTHVQIDRNGAGEFTDLLVMNNVQTDLATLLANHQITIA